MRINFPLVSGASRGHPSRLPHYPMKTPTPLLLVLGSLVLPVVSLGQSAPAASPVAAEQEEAVKLEAFTVTGSNIRRIDAETALPVTVFEKVDLDARGASTMSELFETVGAALPSAISEINNGPQLARGDVASVDLRGLGSGSTLVLLNGRRMAPHPISMAENGVPSLATNINSVPRAMISRVEILRDGASAIYGADAAAGVINNHISPVWTGREIRMRGMVTEHGGANEFGVTVAEGFKRGRTHLAVSLDYFTRDAMAAHDRRWSAHADQRQNRDLPAPWNGQPITLPNGSLSRNNAFDNRNNVNQWGEWQRGFIQPDFRTFIGSRPAGNVGITTSTTPPPGVATMSSTGMFYLWPAADGTVNFKQSRPSANIDSPENGTRSNWNNWKVIVPKTQRLQFAAFLDRPLNERVSVFGDVLFYHAYSRTGREPVNFKNTDDQGIYLPAANPWNPFGVRFYHPTGQPNADGTPRLVGTPADVSLWTGISPGQNSAAIRGFKPRVTEVDSYAWRAVGGLRGRFGQTWEWETGVVFSGAQTHEYEHFQVRESRLRRALDRTDGTAFNPFPVTFRIVNNQIVVDQPFSNPDSVLDPLYDSEDRFGRTNLFIWDAKANGRLWRLPFGGGEIGVATGLEVRYETFDDKRAAYVGLNPPGSGAEFPYLREDDNDFLALSSNVPISADQMIVATYLETAFPFVTRDNRRPLINSLEATLAGRFEHFSIHGSSAKPKAGLVWEPVRWLKLRGSVAESFRAPNLVQTNITPLRRQIGASDPYRQLVTGDPIDGTSQRTVFRQGNNNLEPEEATSWTAGLVLEVPRVRGLSLVFDYFVLDQSKAIRNVGAPRTLQLDELFLDLAVKQELAKGTPINQIDLGSGQTNYRGYRFVTRAPVTDADRAAFAAYNAQQTSTASMRAPVGQVVSLIDNYLNLAGLETEGYEFGFHWRAPRTRFGQFTLSGDATRYLIRRSQTEASAPVLDVLGRDGRTKWRGTFTTSWRNGPWAAGWFASYYGTFVSTSAATNEAIYELLNRPSHIRQFDDNGITRYYYRVKPFINNNVWASYRFGDSAESWLRGTTVRVGVNNVFDRDPPLSDEQFGYQAGTADNRGRRYSVELSKRF